MIIFQQAGALSGHLARQRETGLRIGFVPTMGALHDGHLHLVRESLRQTDLTVCSIFVNPTQFNNPEDFRHYPITIERDLDRLLSAGCHLLFLPSVSEVYPPDHVRRHYDLGRLEELLEGARRPGHFQGVCQVVDRLLQIVEPHRLFLGQKDYQQCMVLRRLLQLTGRAAATQLDVVPTVRETDGLAMSSRNLRLDQDQRLRAASLYRSLDFLRGHLYDRPFEQLKAEARQQLEEKGFEVDYVEIAAADSLEPLSAPQGSMVALVAAATGGIRLIDNLPLNA